MLSAKMPKLLVFVLLYGCSIPLGSALPKNVIHGQHITGASVIGHLKARTSFVDYTEAYNQLMKLLHEIYGDDVGKVLQDPEWLTRVCSQVCASDDQKCRQECVEKQIGYFDVNHIARCATHCENIPHQGESSLQGEYGACLVPCLKHQHENTDIVENPAKENPTPTGAVEAPSNQGSSQTFPYSVTLMDASTTSVIQVISQITHGVEDLSVEDTELKYLTPAVRIITSPKVSNSDTTIAKEATAITGTTPTVPGADLSNLKQSTSDSAPSPTSDINASPGTALAPTATDFPLVADTTLLQSVDAAYIAPTPFTLVANTNTTTVGEDSDFIPSNIEQFDNAPTLAIVVTESDLKTPIPSSIPNDATGTLTTSMVGVMKKIGSGLNFTNITTSTSTGTSKPTLEPGLAEGAAAIDTPFLSFGSSTSVLLAVVIGFGLIMG